LKGALLVTEVRNVFISKPNALAKSRTKLKKTDKQSTPRGETSLRAIAKILGGLAFSVLFLSFVMSRDSPTWVGVALSFFLIFLASVLYKFASYKEQEGKDLDADERVAAALKGEEPFYYLYLRPFSLDVDLFNVNISRSSGPGQYFEFRLDWALRRCGIPLISLGKPYETIGSGHFRTTDQNWKAVFETLAKAAAGLIVVPSLNSGTWFEIEWLARTNLLYKTVFIIPHSTTLDDASLLAAEYQKLGLRFPEIGVGSIFKFSEGGELIARESMDKQLADLGSLIQTMKLFESTGAEVTAQVSAAVRSPNRILSL
jgi:hypothetical protein